MIESAGLLLYRRRKAGIEIFLVHMGGPIWARRDDGAWVIPKGMIGKNEEPLAAARREFREETGFAPKGPFEPLGTIRQNSSKNLTLWAVKGNLNPQKLVSTMFQMEWPPGSGVRQEFPEADRGAWFGRARALQKIVKGQRPAVENFFARFAHEGD
jgi:predicted NUDIX family NTP pyrophosphohydrolase